MQLFQIQFAQNLPILPAFLLIAFADLFFNIFCQQNRRIPTFNLIELSTG